MALSDDITTAAGTPKRSQFGDMSQENRSLDELIKADEYLEQKRSVTGNGRKLIINKLRPPGSV